MVAKSLSDIGNKDTKDLLVNVSLSPASGASATTKLLDGVSGKRIVVTSLNEWHVQMAGSADVAASWKSGTTALTGPIRFTNAYDGLTASYMPDGHFKTAAGEDLNLTLTNNSGSSAAIQVDGFLNYYIE